MNDIESKDDIQFLVDSFYKKVVIDDVIGKFFTVVVDFDWSIHIPIIVSFWETVLFGKSSYKGNPMAKHVELNNLSKLEPQHFERWLALWKETINENFTGENALEAVSRAETIAKLMQNKIHNI